MNAHIRCIGNQLSEENIFVAVKRVDNNIHKPRHRFPDRTSSVANTLFQKERKAKKQRRIGREPLSDVRIS